MGNIASARACRDRPRDSLAVRTVHTGAMATTLADLLPRVGDPSRPLITFDDRASGERVELSATTTANWVAKTASLLVDELDAEPGERVRIALPTHWLRMVWLLSAWTVGATVTETDARIAVTGPDLQADEPVRLAASLRPLGAPFAEPPQGFVDLATVVPGQPDDFAPLDPPTPRTVALDVGPLATHADLLALEPSAERLLVGPGPLRRDAELLVAALLGGGSLVLLTGADEQTRDRVADQERARVLPPGRPDVA